MKGKMVVTNKRNPAPPGVTKTVYIGRPSPLGNPFYVGEDGSRDEVVAKYRGWIGTTDDALKALQRIKRMVERGEKVALQCWCAPLPCHGDVIKEIIEQWK